VKRTTVLLRMANGKVLTLEDVVEVELIPAAGMKFNPHQDGMYPMRYCVGPVKAQRKTQVVPITGKVGTA
jgi:hypothetical protein